MDPNNVNPYEQAYGAASRPAAGGRQDACEDRPAAPRQSNVHPDNAPYAYAPPAGTVAAPQKSGKGWIVGIVAVAAALIFCVVSVVSCSSAMSAMMNPFASAGDEGAGLASVNGPSVAVIEMSGAIQYDGSACSPDGLKDLLDQAAENDDVKAVVLRVDSGGGVAAAGEEMAQYVRDFEKPVVVSSAATNASAAYEISSQADRIFVDKTTAIGSIGVILQVTDLSGLYDKLGINIENITSADAKDAGGGTRPLTEEERAWYQAMVDQINETFIECVAAGRDMDIARVRELATGLPFTGIDAVENGLADEIGLFEDAVREASELAGYDEELPTVSLTYGAGDLLDLLDLLGYSESDASAARDALGGKIAGGEVNRAVE